MGIKSLLAILRKESPQIFLENKLKDIKKKVIFVDTSILIHRALRGMVYFPSKIDNFVFQPKTIQGTQCAYISSIATRIVDIKKSGLEPVFVLDGIPLELKNEVVEKRREIANFNKTQFYTKLEQEDISSACRHLKRSIIVKEEEIDLVKSFLQLLGVRTVYSAGESDRVLAYLSKKEEGAVMSEDSDMLPLGAEILLTKSPRAGKYYAIRTRDVISHFGINMLQFAKFCVMLGCDYNKRASGISYSKILKILKMSEDFQKVLEMLEIEEDLRQKMQQAFEYFSDSSEPLFEENLPKEFQLTAAVDFIQKTLPQGKFKDNLIKKVTTLEKLN